VSICAWVHGSVSGLPMLSSVSMEMAPVPSGRRLARKLASADLPVSTSCQARPSRPTMKWLSSGVPGCDQKRISSSGEVPGDAIECMITLVARMVGWVRLSGTGRQIAKSQRAIPTTSPERPTDGRIRHRASRSCPAAGGGSYF
jgi:hypothetical protein